MRPWLCLDLKRWRCIESTGAYPPLLPLRLPLMPLPVIFTCATPFPWSHGSKMPWCDDIWMPGNFFPPCFGSASIACVHVCVCLMPSECVSHTLDHKQYEISCQSSNTVDLFFSVPINLRKGVLGSDFALIWDFCRNILQNIFYFWYSRWSSETRNHVFTVLAQAEGQPGWWPQGCLVTTAPDPVLRNIREINYGSPFYQVTRQSTNLPQGEGIDAACVLFQKSRIYRFVYKNKKTWSQVANWWIRGEIFLKLAT